MKTFPPAGLAYQLNSLRIVWDLTARYTIRWAGGKKKTPAVGFARVS
jgi:hypothetical protein